MNSSADLDDVAVSDLLHSARQRWKTLLVAALIGLLLGYGGSYAFKPRFRSESLLTPVSDQLGGGQAGATGGGSGLAALIGIGGGGETSEPLATLKSRILIENYIQADGLIPILFADRWDAVKQKWKNPEKVPTLHQAFDVMLKALQIKEDSKTGLISVAVEWVDPVVAQKWASDIVSRTNAKLRQQAIERGERNLSYLSKQLEQTSVIEIRTAIYRLIESEIKKVMIAQGNEDYAFRFVDPPFVPERKVFPPRAILAVVGAIISVLAVVLYLHLRRSKIGQKRPPAREPLV